MIQGDEQMNPNDNAIEFRVRVIPTLTDGRFSLVLDATPVSAPESITVPDLQSLDREPKTITIAAGVLVEDQVVVVAVIGLTPQSQQFDIPIRVAPLQADRIVDREKRGGRRQPLITRNETP
jgi:hypothetical protein